MPHLLETYALHCGVKIDKPWIYEQYYPLGEEKYITLQPTVHYQSRQYDYWDEVIEYIHSPLESLGIKIIQLGGAKDQGLRSCTWTQGSTSIGQLAYLIKHSMLHAGVDSSGIHLASAYGKKIVGLYCNQWINSTRPYWSSAKDVFLLEPDRTKRKPSFAAEEYPKTINEIKPEKIAESILALLNIKHEIPYETVHIGKSYPTINIQSVPTSIPRFNAKVTMIVRMDLEFNEDVLAGHLASRDCAIVTDRPIKRELLLSAKDKMKGLTYIIDENHDADFVRFLHENGISYNLLTDFSDSKLKEIKLIYLDYNFVAHRSVNEDDVAKVKQVPMEKLVYKTRKKLLKDGLCYSSVSSLKENLPLTDVNDFSFCPATDSEDFWLYLDDYYIAKVLD